jgi:glycosyltransferase involved in cell wall biosynthesis
MPELSVVIPVYGNEATLPEVVTRLEALGETIPGGFEAVFVIDGSPDASGALLRTLLEQSTLQAQLLWHSRNFGSFAATRTGLAAAKGRLVAVMAADLQEPVELLTDFHRALATGEYDVAVGTRRSRSDPSLGQAGSEWFWKIYRRWVQREMPAGGIDVFACTRKVRDALLALDESNSSLVGLLIWLGYRRVSIPYDRAARPSGRSGWTLRKKVRYLVDSLYSFTDLPITALLVLGVTGVVVSLLGSAIVFVAWAFGGVKVPGYTPLMLSLLTMSSIILSGIGIVGSYVWRGYENSKRRPGSLTMLSESFNDAA